VSGVDNQDASRWRLSVDLNQKRQTSTVTAYSLRHNSSGVIDRCARWVFCQVYNFTHCCFGKNEVLAAVYYHTAFLCMPHSTTKHLQEFLAL